MNIEEMMLKLKREVLDGEPGSALPSKLSDEWLDMAIESVEGMVHGDDDDQEGHGIGMALILKTLSDKRGGATELSVPVQDMFEYTQSYMIELALEEVSRKTDIRANAATLETIFEKDREVEIAQCMGAV